MTNELKTNTDTKFIKLIAMTAMMCDHAGKTLCPEIIIFQIIGRIAYPIFAYCIVVGVMYTRDFHKYLIRLGAFALISQIPYVLAFHPTMSGFLKNWNSWNIFFTLFAGAVLVKGLKEKKWHFVLLSSAAMAFCNLDYGAYSIAIFAALWIFRNSPVYSCIVMIFVLGIKFVTGIKIDIYGVSVGLQGFAVFALPFIYLRTNVYPNINRGVFYVFYPAHLILIFILRRVLGI